MSSMIRIHSLLRQQLSAYLHIGNKTKLIQLNRLNLNQNKAINAHITITEHKQCNKMDLDQVPWIRYIQLHWFISSQRGDLVKIHLVAQPMPSSLRLGNVIAVGLIHLQIILPLLQIEYKPSAGEVHISNQFKR